MTRIEHLLVIAMEECDEVSQRISKALRFGMAEVQPGQPWTNAERIEEEMSDLIGVWNMIRDTGLLKPIGYLNTVGKKARVEKFLELSKQCGTLSEDKV